MEYNWHYLNNPFLPKGQKRNYKRLSILGENHVDSLKSNKTEPGIESLFNRSLPLLEDFQHSLQEKISSKSASKAYNFSFDELIDQMPEKLAFWDANIQTIFSVKSLEYNTIFASNRSAIYRGTSRQILDNIINFKNKITEYPQLASLTIPVKEYVESLIKNRDLKSDKKGKLDRNTDILDKKHDALGVMMYRNLGVLMDIYGEDPKQIERFFMLSMLRTHKKKTNGDSTGSVLNIAPNGTATADFKLLAGKTYLIDIKNNPGIQVYGGNTANQTPSSSPIDLSNEDNEITSEELGYPSNTLMIFKNPNPSTTAEVEIFLLDED